MHAMTIPPDYWRHICFSIVAIFLGMFVFHLFSNERYLRILNKREPKHRPPVWKAGAVLLVAGYAGALAGYMFADAAGGHFYWIAGFAVSFAGLLTLIISRRCPRE